MALIFFSFVWLSFGHAASPVRTLLDENRLDEAQQACRQYEMLAGYDSDIVLACAWVYHRIEKPHYADKVLRKLKTATRLPEAQVLDAYAKVKAGQFDSAVPLLESVERQNAGTRVALLAQEVKAESFEASGKLDVAAFIYKQIVGVDNRRGRAHWGLGRYYLSKGDTRRAVEHLLETTKLWPKHLGSRFNLGVLYMGQDDLVSAARWISECYNLNRADVGVLEQLGNLFEKKGNVKLALKHWQRAVDLKTESAVPAEKLSKYLAHAVEDLIESRNFNEALLKIESLPPNVKDQPKSLFWRGVVYRNLGNYKRASGELLAYLQRQPDDAEALKELGICYLNLELAAESMKAFQRSVELKPMDGYSQAWLAYVLESKGDLEKAREHWNLAITQLKDPAELEKAVRRVTAIEKKLREKKR